MPRLYLYNCYGHRVQEINKNSERFKRTKLLATMSGLTTFRLLICAFSRV